MKQSLSLILFLFFQVNMIGQSIDREISVLQPNTNIKVYTPIDGEFIGQIPPLEKKDLDGSVLFKTDGGLLKVRISGDIYLDKRNRVNLRLYTTQIKDNEIQIVAQQNKKTVHYQLFENGFGLTESNDILKTDFRIITRLKLSADGYPDYYLEFPVIVKITPVGNVDDSQSFISSNAEDFIFYTIIEQKKVAHQ